MRKARHTFVPALLLSSLLLTGLGFSALARGWYIADGPQERLPFERGTYAAARKKGTVRLEGKNYLVKDGDIINIRFNV